MNTSVKHGWFTEHRRWEDFCSAGCGVLIVLSPALTAGDLAAAASISAGLAGVLITMLALLEIMSLQRWEEVLELACGLWVVVSPLVFGYGGTLRLAHFVLGAAVAVLALFELWQDRNRRLEG
ncbi:SPW repeat domain-containing protein [Pelagibius marinus]|uniref:SPW repeat domain-containing protein n=1 Tax=Pelagibius marinus TaxID=2762760 RepID=UPI0018725832|nr:SPW repeat protein [Pelagibius marinus]